MKFIIIIILFLFNLINNNINCSKILLSTKFIPNSECYTDQGCNIINSNYWDNKEAFNQASTTSFEIIITPEIAINNSNPIIINFDKSITMGELMITFPSNLASGETGTINIINSIIVNELIELVNCEILINGNGDQSLFISNEISIINSTITIKNGGSISNDNNDDSNSSDDNNMPTPSISINSNSILNLFDSSSLTGTIINLNGSLLLNDNSNLVVGNELIINNGGSIVSSIDSKINCNKFLILNNKYGTDSILSGTNIINEFYLTPSSGSSGNNNNNIVVSKTTLGSNSTIQYLELSKYSNLITGVNSFITIVDALLDGNITVSQSSSLRINQNNSNNITVNGVITLLKNSNSYFSNMIFPSNSIISNVDSKYSNITIEYGTVEFLDSLSIFGQIELLGNTTLYTSNGLLMLELCILSNGGTTIVDGLLVCQNQDYYQNGESTLIVNNGTKTYIRCLYNQGGVVHVSGQDVLLRCDVESVGGIFEISIDSNVYVQGHMDLTSSILDIGGIGANTIKPALGIRDILTLNGDSNTLYYNISLPLDNMDSHYYLIDTNIEIDGNFTQFIGSDLLNSNLNVQLLFVYTQSSGTVHPGSLEIEFNFTDKPKHLDKIWIAVGIIVPLLVIAILIVGIWKYKKNRKYNEYKSILSDDITDNIFNNSNKEIDDNFDL